jgi:hypothetical protein
VKQKYCVLKWDDVRKHLDPAQQQQFGDLLAAIQTRRLQNNTPEDQFFVANMKDKYAQGAVEGYIRAVEEDMVNQHNTGVIDAVTHARRVRANALMTLTPRLPT